MTVVQAQIIMPAKSGIPADVMTNTLHFNTSALTFNWPNLDDIIFDFYDDVASGASNSIASQMTSQILDNEWTIKYYDLDEPKPRVPAHEETRTVTLGTGNGLPAEVACCLSFQGSKESGVNQASRRNRIYLGGLTTGANGVNGRPTSNFIDVVRKNARTMLAAANNSIAWEWVVYSPKLQTQTGIANGWVDDAWDTQRR